MTNLGREIIWQLLLTGFPLIVSVAGAAALIQRREVPAWTMPVPVAWVGLTAVGLALVALWDWTAQAPETLRLGVYTHAGLRLLGVHGDGAGGRRDAGGVCVCGCPRCPSAARSRRSGWGGGPGLPGVLVAGGVLQSNLLFAGTWAALYGLWGPPAAAGAAMVSPLVVGIGELATSAVAEFLMPSQVSNVPPSAGPRR